MITLEDGILEGGFGEKIARFYGSSDVKTLCFGLEKKFYDRYDVNEFMQKASDPGTDSRRHDCSLK